MILKRITRAYLIVGKTFNTWASPLFTGLLILLLRLTVLIGRLVDHIIFGAIRRPLKNPIIIVGNPRSGTTFLHRFLIKQNIFSVQAISELVENHLSGKKDSTFKVWSFFCFQKWYIKTYKR